MSSVMSEARANEVETSVIATDVFIRSHLAYYDEMSRLRFAPLDMTATSLRSARHDLPFPQKKRPDFFEAFFIQF